MTDKRNADPRSEASKKLDLISRGDYTSTPVGKTVFFLYRAIEPLVIYSILAHGTGSSTLSSLGLRTRAPGPPAHTGIPFIDSLGLSPYRLALLGMSVGSAVKQNIWVSLTSGEPLSVRNALIIGTGNLLANGLNTYVYLLRTWNASLDGEGVNATMVITSTLVAAGLLVECIAELQRKQFKDDPANKGKPYTGGLFQYARHVNYGAYSVWRAAYAVAGGGWIYGSILGGLCARDLALRACAILNEYCEKRYGDAWKAYKQQTRWRMVPGIY